MKQLVLGGAGFMGANLVRALVAAGDKPRIFNRPSRALSNLQSVSENIEIVAGDFMDDVALKRSLQGIDVVFHLVSTTFPSMTQESSFYDALSNLLPTIRLLELCNQGGVRKLIYASSGGTIYGEPVKLPITEDHPLLPKSAYGQSKLTVENYLRFFQRMTGLEVDILRISNPYGPYQNPFGVQGLVAVAMGCALTGRPLRIFGKGETVRDYIYIADVAQAMVCAAETPGSTLVNVSSGEGRSTIEIVEAIERITGKKIKREFVPQRSGDVAVNILSNQQAKHIYSWQPHVTFDEGIKKTWDWMLNNKIDLRD